MKYPRVLLKPGKEKPVRNAHPWVFSGAIARVEGQPRDGDVVDVADAGGAFLARGFYNRQSQLTVRLFAWDEDETLDGRWLRERIAQALAWRQRCTPPDTNAYRVVFSEADGVPGLIVDRYTDVLTVQLSTLGLERRKAEVVEALVDVLQPRAIVERADAESREREGLTASQGPLWGKPPAEIEMVEAGLRFVVDLRGGQKTGFYLDQRVNRARVAAYCQGARVLNAFAYTGAFAVYAARAGAEQVVNVDTSAEALALAERHMTLNGFDRPQDEYIVGDVFQVLRAYRDRGEAFDVIILDPPKFAHSAGQVERATRGYKDINLQALRLLRPEGMLATFSCSGLISADLFQKVLFGASVDARRPAQIVERLTQAPDHPVRLSFPESEYLKGLVCRVL
ncbi:MAG: class I SAM-dependent rRNA methyltransferase [Anaerolineae bacterium]|nr:class I SAM-dependent rRNA methyltransferase [Anaerolineae bacterium]